MPVLSRCATLRPVADPKRVTSATGRPGEGVDAGIVRCERGEGVSPMARGGREDAVMGELLAFPPRTSAGVLPHGTRGEASNGLGLARVRLVRGGKATRVAITMPSGP